MTNIDLEKMMTIKAEAGEVYALSDTIKPVKGKDDLWHKDVEYFTIPDPEPEPEEEGETEE